MFPRQTIAAAATVGNLTVSGTLSVAGTSTLAAVNASGTVAAAGAVTVGTTLGVTGITTLAAGTLAAPSLTFTGSAANTGFYASTADQIQMGRSGVAAITLTASGGVAVSSAMTTNGAVILAAAFRPQSGATQTNDYTMLTTDRAIAMNVTAGGTMTMPATPLSGLLYWPCLNMSANPLTVARNGNTINGAASDVTIAAGALFMCHWNHQQSTWEVGEIAPA